MNHWRDAGIKRLLRWVISMLLIGLCSPFVTLTLSAQDNERRLWNKQFMDARKKARKRPPKVIEKAIPAATCDGELVGVTIWRLRAPTSRDGAVPRLLIQKNNRKYVLERTAADMAFEEGELLRLSIEMTRPKKSYLYIIDQELHESKKTGNAFLIFPSLTTPRDGNVVQAGKSVFVPAIGDPIPHFTLERSGPDQIAEKLTIIISPEPLPLPISINPLDSEQAKQPEAPQDDIIKKVENEKNRGHVWTIGEKVADAGGRKLTQGDPLPQAIYCVKRNPDRPLRLTLQLPLKR